MRFPNKNYEKAKADIIMIVVMNYAHFDYPARRS